MFSHAALIPQLESFRNGLIKYGSVKNLLANEKSLLLHALDASSLDIEKKLKLVLSFVDPSERADLMMSKIYPNKCTFVLLKLLKDPTWLFSIQEISSNVILQYQTAKSYDEMIFFAIFKEPSIVQKFNYHICDFALYKPVKELYGYAALDAYKMRFEKSFLEYEDSFVLLEFHLYQKVHHVSLDSDYSIVLSKFGEKNNYYEIMIKYLEADFSEAEFKEYVDMFLTTQSGAGYFDKLVAFAELSGHENFLIGTIANYPTYKELINNWYSIKFYGSSDSLYKSLTTISRKFIEIPETQFLYRKRLLRLLNDKEPHMELLDLLKTLCIRDYASWPKEDGQRTMHMFPLLPNEVQNLIIQMAVSDVMVDRQTFMLVCKEWKESFTVEFLIFANNVTLNETLKCITSSHSDILIRNVYKGINKVKTLKRICENPDFTLDRLIEIDRLVEHLKDEKPSVHSFAKFCSDICKVKTDGMARFLKFPTAFSSEDKINCLLLMHSNYKSLSHFKLNDEDVLNALIASNSLLDEMERKAFVSELRNTGGYFTMFVEILRVLYDDATCLIEHFQLGGLSKETLMEMLHVEFNKAPSYRGLCILDRTKIALKMLADGSLYTFGEYKYSTVFYNVLLEGLKGDFPLHIISDAFTRLGIKFEALIPQFYSCEQSNTKQ